MRVMADKLVLGLFKVSCGLGCYVWEGTRRAIIDVQASKARGAVVVGNGDEVTSLRYKDRVDQVRFGLV